MHLYGASFEDSNRTVELFNLQLTMADQKNDDAQACLIH